MFTKEHVQKSRMWFFILGGILILLGMAAVAAPLFMSLAIEQILGWIFLAGGAVQIFHWYQARKRGSSGWSALAVGVLTILAGIVLLAKPLQGVLTLTLILCFYFVALGIMQIMTSFRVRPFPGWTWMLLSGGVTLVLGLMIWRQFPSSAAWSIGLLVGINLLLTGWSTVALALGAKKS